MQINSDTLKMLRKRQNLSQDGLAQKAKIAKRTIARLESDVPPKNVRNVTVERLAGILKVEPAELGKPFDELSDDKWRERGYAPLKVLLRDEMRVNYRFVMHHYGVGLMDLIDAAPWMFTLLAEMSLAQRRLKLEEYDSAFQDAMRLLPSHLAHGAASRTDNEWAVADENDSLAARDVFGAVLLNSKNAHIDPFNPSATNPFHAFVKELAEGLATDAIDPELIECPNPPGMPSWPLFQKWLDDLTGGDSWAKFAVENVKNCLADMPEKLKGPDKTAERIEWLVRKISPEARAREEQRRAKWATMLGNLGL